MPTPVNAVAIGEKYGLLLLFLLLLRTVAKRPL
jgi:hypothetical protein